MAFVKIVGALCRDAGFDWEWFTGGEMGLDVGVTFHLPDQRPLVLTTSLPFVRPFSLRLDTGPVRVSDFDLPVPPCVDAFACGPRGLR